MIGSEEKTWRLEAYILLLHVAWHPFTLIFQVDLKIREVKHTVEIFVMSVGLRFD